MLPDSLTAYAPNAISASTAYTLSKKDVGSYIDRTVAFYTPRELMVRSNPTPYRDVDVSFKWHEVFPVEHDTAGGGTTESLFPFDVILTVKSKRPAMDSQLVSVNPITLGLITSRVRILVETILDRKISTDTEAVLSSTVLGRAIYGER